MATENPYAKMRQWQRDMLPSQRIVLYNLRPYRDESYPSPNLWGLGEGGQNILWQAALADQQACWGETRTFRDMVVNHLQGENGWVKEAGVVQYLSATQFAVSGVDQTGIYEVNRALSAIQQATAFGYVAAAVYEPENTRTVITVADVVLDVGLSEMWLGLSPKCAPKTDSVGSTMYLAQNCNAF